MPAGRGQQRGPAGERRASVSVEQRGCTVAPGNPIRPGFPSFSSAACFQGIPLEGKYTGSNSPPVSTPRNPGPQVLLQGITVHRLLLETKLPQFAQSPKEQQQQKKTRPEQGHAVTELTGSVRGPAFTRSLAYPLHPPQVGRQASEVSRCIGSQRFHETMV